MSVAVMVSEETVEAKPGVDGSEPAEAYFASGMQLVGVAVALYTPFTPYFPNEIHRFRYHNSIQAVGTWEGLPRGGSKVSDTTAKD